MKYYCNPVNINYRYQFNADQRKNRISICREAADPSMINFKGRYYIFASMTLGVWVSDDLVNWENHRLPSGLPLYDYAPDVRVMGEYVYFCASKKGEKCDRYRTKDITQIDYEPCKCGRTFARMAKIKGRSDDMLKIRGVNEFLICLWMMMEEFISIGDAPMRLLSGEWSLTLRK